MTYYGPRHLAASFRTVRKNTLILAEEIPEEHYGFRPTPTSKTVGETLTHIALGPRFQEQIQFMEHRSSMAGFDFLSFRQKVVAESAQPRTKAEIIQLLISEGEKFAQAVESVPDEFLGESVTMPPGATPESRTRFDMLAGVKEHEMHHRAQLMLVQRMLGITPHLTREFEARVAAMEAAAAKATNQPVSS